MEGSEGRTSEPSQPPYGSVKWYEDFFKLLERIHIDKVDAAFLKIHNIAVGNEYKLVSGLRFLDLVDEDGNATEKMATLRVVGNEFTKNLEKIVRDAYAVLVSKIDFEKALPSDLVNCLITDYHMARSTATRGAKIFVFLAQKSEIPISQALADMRKPELEVTRKRKVKKEKIRKKKEAEEFEEELEEKKGMHKIAWGNDILIYLREGDKKMAEKAKVLIDLYIRDLEGSES